MINEIFVRKIDISDALVSLYPDTVWRVINDPLDYNNLIWEDENVEKPSEDILRTEIKRLQAIQNSQLYQYKRQPEYPNLADQLDMLWHAIDQNKLDKTSDFYQFLKAVKDKYPKG